MPWLLQIIVALVIVGLVLWVIDQIPMDATIAKVIRIIVIVAVALWLLQLVVGLFSAGGFTLFPAPVRR